IDEDFQFLLVGDTFVETCGDLHGERDLLFDDLLFPVLTCGNDFNLWSFFQRGEYSGRVVTSDDHNFRRGLFRLINDALDESAEADAQERKQKEWYDDAGDDGAAVTERFAKFFTVDDANVVERHLLNLRFHIEGGDHFYKNLFEVLLTIFFAKLRERTFCKQFA